jgi:S-adenosylmethionine hydrolase
MGIITFMSDFGTRDSYVGAVKGVILSINPSIKIVDIAHDLENFNIKSAAYQLDTFYTYYPKGTIHLAVIDPGVGGKRKALIIKTRNYVFVGPDNGLFSYIIKNDDHSSYYVNPDKIQRAGIIQTEISNTFHARDVFAPTAAFISKGGKIDLIAEKTYDEIISFESSVIIEKDHLIAGITDIDQFGNIVTEISKSDFNTFKERKIAEIRYKDYIFNHISQTYEDVPMGKPLILWGSSGHMEISVNRGNGAEVFSTKKEQDKIIIKFH